MNSNLFTPEKSLIIPQTWLILDSFYHWTNKQLLTGLSPGIPLEIALYEAPFPVITSNNLPDPILTYGNLAAQALWEMNWTELTSTPGRLTAELIEQSQREVFLKTVRENGFISDYKGARISKTGRRFEIQNATVWNLIDAKGNFLGQAATFKEYRYL